MAEHSKATWKGRVVLVQLALAARPCGCPAGDTTRADLVRRTGLSLTTIRDGIAEVKELGEVKPLEQGGGRSRPTRYALVVALCHPDAGDCWSCSVLAEVLTNTGRHTPCFASSDDGNRAPQHRNRAPRAPTTARKQGARAARRKTESQRLARLRAEQSLNEEPHVGGEAGDAGGAGGGEPPASTAQPGSNKAPKEKPARTGGRATRATGPLGGDGTTAEAAPLDVPALVDVGQQTPPVYGEPREVLALLDTALGPLKVLGEWPTGEVPPRACRRWLTKEEAAAERRMARKRDAKSRACRLPSLQPIETADPSSGDGP